MALVMLPCDLPWWPTLARHLQGIAEAKDSAEFVDGMLKIHNMCNIGLDPDEPDRPDQTLFEGLQRFLDEELSAEEREHFLHHTGPAMARRALDMKAHKPPGGLHFSLQQQGDRVEYDRQFIACLLAHAFFSTYPKRTPKTHPTLQDCNFSMFFKNLDQKCQKAKLRSIWRYFDEMELDTAPTDRIIISREVMTGKEWLTIEDWLECELPLCQLAVRHEGRVDRAEPAAIRVCFANSRLGGAALEDGASQECVQFLTCPELLVVLLRVEALEDNEALLVENLLQVSRIADPRHRAAFEPVTAVTKPGELLTVCCLDAENYRRLPLSQFEEDNVLRELNKALLGFRQHRWVPPPQPEPGPPPGARGSAAPEHTQQRRLSPIGESFSSTQSDTKEATKSPQLLRARTPPSGRSVSPRSLAHRPPRPPGPSSSSTPSSSGPGTLLVGAAARRGRFIVLGSSGECLPVSRRGLAGSGRQRAERGSRAPSAARDQQQSDSDEYHSALSSQEDSSDSEAGQREAGAAGERRYSAELDTPQRRSAFADRLRDALLRGRERTLSSESGESIYAVGITVAGTGLADEDIRLRRGGSRGFMLDEESCSRGRGRGGARAGSSRYSFDTEFSSDDLELEAACDQFERWLEDPTSSTSSDLDTRDLAVAQFASRLLKRTLSDSFAGVHLSDQQGDDADPAAAPRLEGSRDPLLHLNKSDKKLRLAHIARSMSLELARHRHRLASQLVCQLGATLGVSAAGTTGSGMRAVATGNWGCGSERAGDPQLKLVIQWLAASVAGAPRVLYYTCGHHKLLKLDTVCRIVVDRHWTVGQLAQATLGFAQTCLDSTSPPHTGQALFEALLGAEH